MSKIPEVPKAKYNQKDPFSWVDYQWEKFMEEQKELKAHIKQLQADLVTCNEHFQTQRKQLEDLVSRVPSKLLTKSDVNKTYIYESPDNGKTLYRREFGDYDTPREPVDKDGNPLPKQLNLF
tara:strand:- start:258 stop:623 length:366 start_codon:yes stop_codon:yes gene_type:complete